MSGPFNFDNTFAREMQGFYVPCQPEPVGNPALVYFNQALADELGIHGHPETFVPALAGNQALPGAQPLAQVYAGHQFGGFSPQLGDGRALLLGEVCDQQGQRWDIALKGSGQTPFSRRGDGRAALGPMLREVLIGEAMHALGIPTTRALAVVTTGETVYRDRALPGAILTRGAASHLRVGTFEYFAARGAQLHLRRLADYAIARHYPELLGSAQPCRDLLAGVVQRQAALIAQWMSVGFIHGVMNTDNMTISGETIDYGPCAFMEAYHPETVFSSIDQHGRYAYGQQPAIAAWNLVRFAETLLPLLSEDAREAEAIARELVAEFDVQYQQLWLQRMRSKLGLSAVSAQDALDEQLVLDWLDVLQQQRADFTQGWYVLIAAAEGSLTALHGLVGQSAGLSAWLSRWQSRMALEHGSLVERQQLMRQHNPRIIPRNHRVEEALGAASERQDYSVFENVLHALQQPDALSAELEHYAEAADSLFTARYLTYCGT